MGTDETHNQKVARHIAAIMPRIEHGPTAKIPCPYLMATHGPAYDRVLFHWDHHHMSMRFAYAGRPEYLRFLVENLLHYQKPDGSVPYAIHPEYGPSGATPQPFLAQGAALYVERTGDLAWGRVRFDAVRLNLAWFEKKNGAPMGVFRGPFTSGFDNDIVTSLFFPGTVVPCDLSAWMYLEYRALGRLAQLLGRDADRAALLDKAEALKRAANALLWHADKESFAAYSLCEGRHLFGYDVPLVPGRLGEFAFQTVSNLIPLYTGLADGDKARTMIRRYVLSEDHFLSPFGIRTLSKASEFYNNAKWGNPPRFSAPGQITASNWQGPVWIPICYFMFHALRRNGFGAEAQELARRTLRVLAESIDRIGCFTENYHGETGEPLYARDFAAWNILADVMRQEAEDGAWIMEPFYA